MPLRTTKIDEDSLRYLEALETWLSDLGMQKYDRIHEAIEVVREADKQRLALPGPAPSNEFLGDEPFAMRRFLYANLDVTEFLDIFDAFRAEPYDRIAPKLARALSGPFMPLAETKDNADARNIQFELTLAAEWRLYGLNVSIGEPDLTLSAGATNFIIECKRPYREESIRANIRGAKHQLATRLDMAESFFGAVAISVSRILVPGTHTLMNRSALPSVKRNPLLLQRALSQEAGEDPRVVLPIWTRGLGRDIQRLMDRNRWSRFDFHDRLVGMFFHAAPPFVLGGGRGRLAVSVIAPVGRPGPGFTYLHDVTEAAYGTLGSETQS
jgi:hypothetical protein